jgi:hypothetical protein
MKVDTEAGIGPIAAALIPNDSPKQQIMKKLSNVIQELAQAYNVACKTNPMASDLPVFQQMQGIGKDVNGMLIAVSKLRGLE